MGKWKDLSLVCKEGLEMNYLKGGFVGKRRFDQGLRVVERVGAQNWLEFDGNLIDKIHEVLGFDR